MIIFVCIIYMVKMLLSTGHFSTLKTLFFVHLLIVMSDAGRLTCCRNGWTDVPSLIIIISKDFFH